MDTKREAEKLTTIFDERINETPNILAGVYLFKLPNRFAQTALEIAQRYEEQGSEKYNQLEEIKNHLKNEEGKNNNSGLLPSNGV